MRLLFYNKQASFNRAMFNYNIELTTILYELKESSGKRIFVLPEIVLCTKNDLSIKKDI